MHNYYTLMCICMWVTAAISDATTISLVSHSVLSDILHEYTYTYVNLIQLPPLPSPLHHHDKPIYVGQQHSVQYCNIMSLMSMYDYML